MSRWASITPEKVILDILVDNKTMKSWLARTIRANSGFWVLLDENDNSSVGDTFTTDKPFESWAAINTTGLLWDFKETPNE